MSNPHKLKELIEQKEIKVIKWTNEMESAVVMLVDEMGYDESQAESIVEDMVEKNIPLENICGYVAG